VTKEYDAIVIGGGHNGLINAAYLAKAGLDVVVLEKRHLVGGATVTEELYPGYHYSVFSYVVSLLRPEIILDLELPRHGLVILPLESTLTPLENGDGLYRDGDAYRTFRDMARFSRRDAETYFQYGRTMYFMAKAVKDLLTIVPPEVLRPSLGDVGTLLDLAKHFLSLDQNHLYTLIKLMTMSSAEFLEEWFETDALIATLSASGIIGTFLGPRSPGTAYVLLHHYMGEIDGAYRAWGFAKGGTGGIAEALRRAAEAQGALVKLEAPVAHVMLKNGRARGVALENGDELKSKVVISSLDPQQSFFNLMNADDLPTDFVKRIKRYRSRGSSAKVNLALDSLPSFSCMPHPGPHMRGAVSISPSVSHLERAYDDAKYGRFSQQPYIDIIFPSMIDPGMAPPGKHVMSCFVQYAPFELADSNWDDSRDALGDAVLDTLDQFAPGIKNLVLHRQVVTPLDMERSIALTGGNIFQGELSLEQLFFLRPIYGYAQYRTPVNNYYLCGSAAHPGGGISGAPARMAAMEILKDLGR
jgi:phytoene dehydrogenase-like protein